ncbi:MAG: SIR2 family protein, partial [Reyranellales bacterium]
MIAAAAKQKYDATYGVARPPLAPGIEDQAEFFFQRNELATVYFGKLVDRNAFAGEPNVGHAAVADLLLVGGIQTGVTTNVDCLIETAAQLLHGQIGIGIDGASVAALGVDVAPLLKIHGCRHCDPANMVWAPGQLLAEPVASRIASSAAWLNVRLLNRDLLIVGYSTDWDYLNHVLEAALGAVNPARVLVVDLLESAAFEAKAPVLHAIGERAGVAFQQVKASGAEFLASLRLEFSRSYVRRVLHSGAAEFEELTGAPPSPALTEPADLDNSMLWRVRRDLEGCGPRDPAGQRTPPVEPLLGLTLLQLRAKGAAAEGPYWLLNGRRIRVLRAVNAALHRVEALFEREVAPTVAPDIVVAVGAE